MQRGLLGKLKRLVITFLVLQGIGLFVLLRNCNFLYDFLRLRNVVSLKGQPEDDDRFKENYFNVALSDKLPFDRPLPDVRPKFCPRTYNTISHLDTSIIIVFHNEAKSTFYRTLTSICNRTPPNFIKEIILVNDKSENRAYLSRDAIISFVSKLPVKVILVESSQRLGLMKARMVGVEQATGQTLTFLDSHVEVTEGWLEPLLHEITENNATVVCPIIDVINSMTFKYETTVDNCWGGFDFGLGFQWFTMARKTQLEYKDKIITPVMAGGLFTISADFFLHLGGYDTDMKVWGYENIEMSLRTWMCGGQLIMSKCSHVGHVFREHTPYTFPQGVTATINANLKRTVDVWLDEYRDIVYKTTLNGVALASNALNVDKRIELRKQLKCKPFKWYLENIYPEAMFPTNCKFYGLVESEVHRRSCFCSGNPLREGTTTLDLCGCQKQDKQLVQFTQDSLIRIGYHCLTLVDGTRLELRYCFRPGHELENRQWTFNPEGGFIVNVATNKCISNDLKLVDCVDDISNRWTLKKFSSFKF